MVQGEYVAGVAIRQVVVGILTLLDGRASGITRVEVPENQRLIALLGNFTDEVVVITIRLIIPSVNN